ncbi:hypothetical protein HII31_06732 [Pseudocercospora fuligena]|uniref:Uncharacterized protein n=1 Tax=Pseudocercospora fuligena TaxID=685502 RepID=A0A8H6VIS4_9PEZI|nr:hypothetical protein HII31_06732 [Pseudocercospora fuligena]
MVQYRDEQLSLLPSQLWELPLPLSFDLWSKVRNELKSKGTSIRSYAPDAYLKHLNMRMECGLVLYETCTIEELQGFCARRGIPIPLSDSLTTPARKQRSLITRLKTADKKTDFQRFLDLPPELRVQIYVHYFTQVRNSLPAEDKDQAFSQPPITTVSRIIRKEALPEYYKIFTPSFEFVTTVTTHAFLGPSCHWAEKFIGKAHQDSMDQVQSLDLIGTIVHPVTDLYTRRHTSWQIKLDLHAGKAEVYVKDFERHWPRVKTMIFADKTLSRVQEIIKARVEDFVNQRKSPEGKIQLRPQDVGAFEALFRSVT